MDRRCGGQSRSDCGHVQSDNLGPNNSHDFGGLHRQRFFSRQFLRLAIVVATSSRLRKPQQTGTNRAPDQTTRYNQIAMSLGLLLGAICMPPQMVVGDWSAKVVAKTQPIKFAAMESHFKTERGAALLIGGIPDMKNQTVHYGIKVPKLLSFLAFADLNAEVQGLEDFPADELPPVPVVHFAFQLMVGAGTLLMAFSILAFIRWFRGRAGSKSLTAKHGKASSHFRSDFFKPRWFLWMAVASGPLAVIAMETGWTVTEVGRQPWIVYGSCEPKTL